MGIKVKIDSDCETFVVDAAPDAPMVGLENIEAEVTQEDIDNASSGRDAIRRGIERALMRRLLA